MTPLKLWCGPIVILALLPRPAFSPPQAPEASPPPAQIQDYLPAKVAFLKHLATAMPLPNTSRLTDPNNHSTKRAKIDSINWIMKVVDKQWLPPDPNILRESIILIQNAFGPHDVTYSQWEAHDHFVQAAQMCTILLIRVRPRSSHPALELTTKARVALARDAVTHVIKSEIDFTLNEPTGRKRIKKTIAADVRAASFGHADIRLCADGLHATCAPPRLFKAKSLFHLRWWRSMNWWADGDGVGLYFLKTEGGPWVPSYTSALDAPWFEGSPYRNKSGKRVDEFPPRR
jgi:hypothetical protein